MSLRRTDPQTEPRDGRFTSDRVPKRETKGRVVVLDGDESARDALVMLLEAAGYEAEQIEGAQAALRRLLRESQDEGPDAPAATDLVAESPGMRRVLEVVAQIAPSRAGVLLTGESGTGKGLIAQIIHERSGRTGPLLALHGSTLAETLLDPASRSADVARLDGGTLLLDEVGELPLPLQVKLLRLLQERTLEPVGAEGAAALDVRVVATTHKNLAAEVIAGRFREDLYYRLNVVNIDLPPLRARAGDVAPLATHFARRFARESGKAIAGLEDAALERLAGYRWPGNVRELRNAMEHAVAACEGDVIRAQHLPQSVAGGQRDVRAPGSTMAEIERAAIIATLDAVGGNTAKAAKMLDVSIRKIQYRLKDYGLEPARRRKKAP